MQGRFWMGLGLSIVLAWAATAAGPDEEYVRIYKTIVEADSLRDSGQREAALTTYKSAKDSLEQLQASNPTWNERLIAYRLNYIKSQINPGTPAQAPPSNPTPARPGSATASPNAPANRTIAPAQASPVTIDPQIQKLREENQNLKAAATRLEAKLKEALSVQPAPSDPKEMSKLQDQLRELAKENDQLKFSLQEEQKKIKSILVTNTVVSVVTNFVPVEPADLADLRRNLTNQIAAVSALRSENELLKKEVATAKSTPPPAAVNPESEKQLQEAIRDLKAMQAANQELLKKQTTLEQQLNEAKVAQASQEEKLKRVEAVERDLTQSRSEAQKLEEQKQLLEKRLAENINNKSFDTDSSRRVLKLETDLLSSQSEVRLLTRQKSELLEKLSTAKSTPSSPAQPATAIIPGAGGEAASVEVHRQLKQAAWEILNLQALNQTLLNKQAALEQQLVRAGAGKVSTDTIDQDRLRRLEKLNEELTESKRLTSRLELENQEMARQLAQSRQAPLAAASPVKDEAMAKKLQEAQTLLRQTETSNRELEKRTQTLQKELAAAKVAIKQPPPTPPPAPTPSPQADRLEQDLATAREAAKRLEQENRDLEKKLALAEQAGNSRRSSSSRATNSKNMEKELASLRSRLGTLEAKAIPYTEEELGLFGRLEASIVSLPSANSSNRTVDTPAPPAESSQKASGLVAEARSDFDAGRFAEAERKFAEALKQDDRNAYTLAHLAAAQFELQKLGEAEKTTQKALAQTPDDAACLYMLGIIRLRQEKVDEALDALGRSAKANPQNAVTQNSLGVALSQKGLREPAETAFRRALQLRPDYADAHYNLSVEYVLQQPPSFKLAQWHYQKAIGNGHPKNAELEKRLEAAAASAAGPAVQ